MDAVNIHDAERSNSFFSTEHLTSDRPSPFFPSGPSSPDTGLLSGESDLDDSVKASDTNCGQLSDCQKRSSWPPWTGLPGRVCFQPIQNECSLGDELVLPLIYESHPPMARKQRRFSPHKTGMIRDKVEELLECGVIRPSKTPWAAPVLCA